MASTSTDMRREPAITIGFGSVTPSSVTLTTAGTGAAFTATADTSNEVGFTHTSGVVTCEFDGPVYVDAMATFARTQAASEITFRLQLSNDGGSTWNNVTGAVGAVGAATATLALSCGFKVIVENCRGVDTDASIAGTKFRLLFTSDTNADTAEVYSCHAYFKRLAPVRGISA